MRDRPLAAAVAGPPLGLLALLAVPALACSTGSPSTSWARLRTVLTWPGTGGARPVPGTEQDLLAPVVAVVALAAWACAAWLLLVVLVDLASRVPGLTGYAAHRLLERLAPVSVRLAVRSATGLLLAGSVLTSTAGTALATDLTPGASLTGAAAPAGTDLDWPTLGAAPTRTPAATTAPAPVGSTGGPPSSPPRVTRTAPAPTVTVRHGDTLWSLAREQLRADGEPATDRQTAAAWPSWWQTNRALVGEDPDLLHPGTVLRVPPSA